MKLQLGVIAPPIYEQLDEQDLAYDKTIINNFDMDRLALTRLRIRGILSNAPITKGFDKLFKMIARHVADEENKQIQEDEDGQEGQHGAY